MIYLNEFCCAFKQGVDLFNCSTVGYLNKKPFDF